MIDDHLLQCLTKDHWKRIGCEPHHGIALPLSALNTDNNSGIGEFEDLFAVIDWCEEIGFNIIQFLPLNDTGPNISPYSCISTNALDPIYLSIPREYQKTFQPFKKNHLIPYKKIKIQKLKVFRELYEKNFPKLKRTESYLKFINQNPWIHSYAQFCVKSIKNKTTVWEKWPLKDQKYKEEPPSLKEEFYFYLQYLCYEKMCKVKAYADQKKIYLKGDLPILLSPNSVDVWANQKIFSMDQLAGAPPDVFNAKGQKWGFPILKWEELEKTDYHWWKVRLKTAEQYFHLYRIDHAVGFFRIWAIDPKDEAIDGKFVSPNRMKWPFDGKKRFEVLIQSSKMLPLAEDLGIIPVEVSSILKELGICGTRVVRWNRRWKEDCEFVPPKDYEPLTVTTLGTHDTSLFREWWKEYPTEAKLLAKAFKIKYEPSLTSSIQKSFLIQTHQTPSLFHIHPLQEYLSLFPELIHKDPQKERINIPGTDRKENWTYKFLPTFEEIQNHRKLKESMQLLGKGEKK